MSRTGGPALVVVILQDIDHASLWTAGGVVQVVIVEPRAVIKADGNFPQRIRVRNQPLMPVYNLSQRDYLESEVMDGQQIRSQRQVIILRVGVLYHVNSVISEDRDCQMNVRSSRPEHSLCQSLSGFINLPFLKLAQHQTCCFADV